MAFLSRPARSVLTHPLAFARQVLRGFRDNQGLLLAGAAAYYALLSVVPLVILSVIGLSQWVDQAELLATLGRYLEWLVPSQSRAVMDDVRAFLDHRVAIGLVLLGTLVFFGSLAFSVLEKAMCVIFSHREKERKRHYLVAAVLPYGFILMLAAALLVLTAASVALRALAAESVPFLGRDWSLGGVSGVLLYLFGLLMETGLLAAFYYVMPVGRTRMRHALVGGFTATSLWEIVRHLLVWYFTHVSRVSIVYGSLTTAVVALFSMEIAVTILLLGAQVIAEYERLGREAVAPCRMD